MTKCKGESCNNTLGNNNKSGFCRVCAQRKTNPEPDDNPPPRTIQDINDGRLNSADEISAEMMNTRTSDLTVAGVIHLINILNNPIQTKLDQLEKEVKAVTTRISSLEEKSTSVEGSLLSKTTEIADLRTKVSSHDSIQLIQSKQKELREVIDNHQRYLEKSDSFRRENNVVVFGLQESENDDVKVKEILQSIECTNIEPERAKRLGKVPDNPTEVAPGDDNAPRTRNRPLLLTLKSRSEKSKILANSSKLKDSEIFGTIYIKKDQTPAERKEWTRLRTVLKREKDRPDNQGVGVKMDYRRRCVMVGDQIVERGNFRYGPEM